MTIIKEYVDARHAWVRNLVALNSRLVEN